MPSPLQSPIAPWERWIADLLEPWLMGVGFVVVALFALVVLVRIAEVAFDAFRPHRVRCPVHQASAVVRFAPARAALAVLRATRPPVRCCSLPRSAEGCSERCVEQAWPEECTPRAAPTA